MIPEDAPESETRPLARTGVSVVVPTLREAENIGELVARLSEVRDKNDLDLELILVDDASGDGSLELVESLGAPWVKMIVRRDRRGLSSAVLEGLRIAAHDNLVVMDADLSHPPEKIPELLFCLEHGADFVVGSRFVEGGSTDDDWGVFRWLNSRVATLLALPLAPLQDPMSGYFALKRSTFMRGEGSYDPVGYKIGLELLVRTGARSVVEVPIHFTDRRRGQTKLTLKQQLLYLRHVRRLYVHRFGTWSHLAQFLVVGLSGTLVNLLVLTAALALQLSESTAVGVAIFVSMLWNFALNRRFSFSYARGESLARQFAGFVAACSVGALVNYVVTMFALGFTPHPTLAALAGIAAGTGFNFLANRFVVFRKKHVRA